MKCAYHPDVETNLRCGKCEKPICPKCMVQTPVGARCPDCAHSNKVPTYRVSRRYCLVAVGAVVGMAIVCGLAWGAIEWAVPLLSLNLLLAPGAGYVISEVVSRSVNLKRGTGLAVVGGMAVALSYAITLFFPGVSPSGFFILYHIIAVALGIFVAVSRLR